MKNIFRNLTEAILVIALGALLGRIYCFVVLMICDYFGKSGYSDEVGLNYIWRPEHDWWASKAGIFFGILIFPLGYYLFLRKTNITILKLSMVFLSMTFGAFLGVFWFPPAVALMGVTIFLVVSFFIAKEKNQQVKNKRPS